MVRRDVVVDLFASMKRRGYRLYRHVIMEDVERRAEHLPKDGVPPEIMKLLPLDQLIEPIRMHKSATPVSTPQHVQEAAADLDVMRWNGIVLEQTSRKDEIDVNAQRNAALQNLLAKLKACPEPISRTELTR